MSVTFRPKGEAVERDFEYIRERFESLTNKENYGKNGALNLAVRAGAEKLRELENEAEYARQHQKNLMDFEEGAPE